MSDIVLVFERQKQFFESGVTRPRAFRIDQLRRLRRLVCDNETRITEALREDIGKPKLEAFSSEIAVLKEEIDTTIKHLDRWMRPQRVPTPLHLLPARSQIISEPLGVVLIIGPWNYPFQLTVAPLIGAIAAGNCAILKPSELTPRTSQLLNALIVESFPPEYISVVEGGISEATDLLALKFNHIFFTGSTAVGRVVSRAAADNLVPTTLELGGKSPAIVCGDADLDLAARRVAWGKFLNAGQTCVAPDYVYVQASVEEQFLCRLKKHLRDFFGEHPKDSESYGRIINDRNFVRLVKLFALDKVSCGGQHERDSLYIDPTIMSKVSWEDPVMQDEIFGPLLPTMTFESLDNVFSALRAREKPLAAYFFSGSRESQKRFLNELSFGGGCINDTVVHLSNPYLPFGGVGASGMGSYHGRTSFLTFSHKKSVLIKSRYFDMAFRYPPYTPQKLGLMRWLFGFR